MSEQSYQNLIDLRGVAERGPERRDMRYWRCGTVCCWLGGFAMEHPHVGFGFAEGMNGPSNYLTIDGDLVWTWEGIGAKFGISLHEASLLFDPDTYPSSTADKREMLIRVDALLDRYAPSARYRPECGESAYAMAAAKVEQAVEV